MIMGYRVWMSLYDSGIDSLVEELEYTQAKQCYVIEANDMEPIDKLFEPVFTMRH